MRQPAHLARVHAALEAHGCGPGISSGRGKDFFCAHHDDGRRSLTVTLGTENPDAVLVCCGAGCPVAAVLAAIGLTLPDLFPDHTRQGRGNPLRTFVYVDAAGVVLRRVARYKNGWGTHHPDPSTGRWVPGKGEAPDVLYRLPGLLENPDAVVHFTEGERDSDTLAKRGVVATTVRSNALSSTDLTPLRGRRVIVIVDNDPTGWQRGLSAMEHLQRAGALVEPEARRPSDDFKDVTEATQANDLTLIPVDLHTTSPPATAPGIGPRRPKWPMFTPDGKPTYAILPTELQLDRRLTAVDRDVWALLDTKAGNSRLAQCTAPDLSRALGFTDRDARAVTKSLQRLIETGWVIKQHRCAYLVTNPVRGHNGPAPALPSPSSPTSARTEAAH